MLQLWCMSLAGCTTHVTWPERVPAVAGTIADYVVGGGVQCPGTLPPHA